MSIQKRIRLTCFHCDNRIVVEFYDLRNLDSAHRVLLPHGWILGLDHDDEGGVIADPLCHKCGRITVARMLAQGAGKIEPDAKLSLKKIYPDLFEEE